MEEEIKRAFNDYLGTPLEKMDRIGQSMYTKPLERSFYEVLGYVFL